MLNLKTTRGVKKGFPCADGRTDLTRRKFKLESASSILQAVFGGTYWNYFDEYNPSGSFGILICIFTRLIIKLFYFRHSKETSTF